MNFDEIRLEEIPPVMASAVLPVIEGADMSLYHEFLDRMYHYTLMSGDRLRYSASVADDADLSALFSELAEEEESHYKLARNDLEKFNLAPGQQAPELVTDFHDFWMSNSGPMIWVGALYSLENVAGHLKEPVQYHLTRIGVSPDQATFILEHLVADDEHGKRLSDICQKCDDKKGILFGARQAAKFWTNLHVELVKS